MQDWILPSKEDLSVEQWGQVPECFDVMARVLLALTFKNTAPSSRTCLKLCTSSTEISVEQSYTLTVFESGLLVKSGEEIPLCSEQDTGKCVVLN